MQPFTPAERKTMLDNAAKAFPNRCPWGMEAELDEYQSLLTQRFNSESGALPPAGQERLATLAAQFQPKP